MKTLELLAVGDISLVCEEGRDPFANVARYFRAGDIVFGNLECVLCEAGTAAEKEVTLRVPSSCAGHLQRAGFTVVNLANNHALDFGSAGLAQTLAALRARGIACIGAGDAASPGGRAIIECRGLKVGFLGFGEADMCHRQDDVFVNRIDRGAILDQLRCLKPLCDVAIVSLHWGIEYARYPSPAQTKLARELAAEGAGVVLGHHPHVVQGIERVGTSLIVYSLGSFQFKPLRNGTTRQSFMLHARISPRGVERYRAIPIWIDEDDLPRLIKGQKGRDTVHLVQRISLPIRENRITERWWFEQVAPVYLHGHLKAWMKRVRKYGLWHFVQFMRWLVSGFTIKCYLGWLRKRARLHG